MSIEFCPHCRLTQNMRSSVYQRSKPDQKEQIEIEKVAVRNFHCEVCNTFVREEEIGLPGSESQQPADRL